MSYKEGWVGTNSWCPNGVDWVEPTWKLYPQLPDPNLYSKPTHYIEYKDSSVVIEIPVPKVKGEEIKLELEDDKLQVTITSDSSFVDVKDFTIDLTCSVKSKTNAVLEYGVLTVTLEKVNKDKTIKVVEL